MSRRRVAVKRKPVPDPRFESLLVSRFINKIMLDGKKSIAQKIFYDALDEVVSKADEKDHLKALEKIVQNVRPLLEVKSRRIGGATYQVPIEVRQDRAVSLAIRWVVEFARGKQGMPMAKALATELTDAYNGQGSAVKRREDTHRMAEANRAFAHYKW